jgi:hypothetical protein
LPAVSAALSKDGDLRPRTPGFRVAAPKATQGTALEKDDRPNARAVTARPALDFQNHAFPFGAGVLQPVLIQHQP